MRVHNVAYDDVVEAAPSQKSAGELRLPLRPDRHHVENDRDGRRRGCRISRAVPKIFTLGPSYLRIAKRTATL